MDTKLVIFLSPQVSLWLFKDNVDVNGGDTSSSRASGAGGGICRGHCAHWSSSMVLGSQVSPRTTPSVW